MVYVASNAWWEELYVRLPELPASAEWTLAVDTWEETVPAPRPVSENANISRFFSSSVQSSQEVMLSWQ